MPATVIIIIGVLFLLFLIRSCFKYPAKSRSARRIRMILIAGTVAVIAVTAFLKYAPRGENSLLEDPGIGENQGSDDKQSYANGGSGDQVPEGVIITVSGGEIDINGIVFRQEKEYAGCGEFLKKQWDGSSQVLLKDNYALSSAFHFIMELLEQNGIPYAASEESGG